MGGRSGGDREEQEGTPRVLYEDAGMYQSLPLRLGQAEINAFLESRMPLQCTHWDAVRFFTPDALPRNSVNGLVVTPESQVDLEQPGCIHTNGDLLKWALKLGPFCPSSLAADCLEVAIQARAVDMRASPYDLSALPSLYPGMDVGLSLEPIRVETAEGRREYQQQQLALYHKAQPLRRELLAVYDRLLDHDWPLGDQLPRTSR